MKDEELMAENNEAINMTEGETTDDTYETEDLEEFADDVSEETEAENKKKKTPFIVLGIIAVLAIVGIVVYFVLDGMGVFGKDVVKKVGDYKNFTYEEYSVEVTDEEVMEYYQNLIDLYTGYAGMKVYEKDESRDGTQVKEGDTVNIDYTGYIDGETFEGGSDTACDLTIGSNSFIEDFENGLIGVTVGETVDLNVKFPDSYYNSSYAGVEAVFTVTVNYVGKEVELTTDNAYNLLLGYETLDALKAQLRATLESEAASYEESYYESKKSEYFLAVIEDSEFTNLDKEAEEYAAKIMEMLESAAASNSMDAETYVTTYYSYASLDEYKTALNANCLREKKRDYLVNEIAKLEDITMSDKEYEELALSIIASYGYDDVEEYRSGYDEQYGEGAFRQYMFDIYVIDILFDKYATMTPAVATGANAE